MNTHDTGMPQVRPMESIKVDNLLINFTTEFQRIYSTKGSLADLASFWRPIPAPDLLPGYFPLGDLAVSADSDINGKRVMAVVCEGDMPNIESPTQKALNRPADFEQVWKSSGSAPQGAIWRPIAPEGYVALGLVCSNGHEKPSRNAVRCVRADLVIAARAADLLWSDRGRGAEQDFSVWSIEPPSAAEGEICFEPGTFIGVNSLSKPSTPTRAYSLRMQIPLRINSPPETPILSGFGAPPSFATSAATQIARLPWFAVEDRAMQPLEKLSKSPYYYLERTDEYALVGYGHNTDDSSKLFRWTTPRVLIEKLLQIFTKITAIEIRSHWPAGVSEAGRPLKFSAQLSKRFTYTETSPNGWTHAQAVEVAVIVPKGKMLAVYQLQSHYDLLREDGTQVAVNFAYAPSDGLNFAEYPRETREEATLLAQTDVPAAIDTAP